MGKTEKVNLNTEIKIWKSCPDARLIFAIFVIFVILFIAPGYLRRHESAGWLIFISLWICFVILMLYRSPKSIEFYEEKIIIHWIIGKSILKRKDIYKLRAIRLTNHHLIWLKTQNIAYRILPIVVHWTSKPYYQPDISRVYDVAEEFENWLKN